jgi:signal transduction histidine kinase
MKRPSQLPERWRERLIDVGVALVVAWFTLAQFGSEGFGEYKDAATDPDALGFVLSLLVAIPLLFRRRWPWAAFVATVAAGTALVSLGYAVHANLGPAVMLFTFASRPDRGRVWPPILFAVAAYATASVIGWETVGLENEDYILPAVIWAAAWLVGDRRRTSDLRKAELEQQREREQQLQIAEERTRIARDLHDSAGHAINTILVQAGAARVLRERDPQASQRAVASIEEVARETLGDIDRIVAALREGEPAERAPLPGVEGIPALVARHRDAGFEFELIELGDAGRPIPQPVARAAYRIAQEALTNAARHGAGNAEIVLEREPDRLLLTVTNPLGDARQPRTRGGLGIVGMRERASLLGGEFDAGELAGGFRVRVALPYDRDGE